MRRVAAVIRGLIFDSRLSTNYNRIVTFFFRTADGIAYPHMAVRLIGCRLVDVCGSFLADLAIFLLRWLGSFIA